ncbi:hypothetical protein ACR6A7_12945 [Pantoea sp. RRHST58]|uniref:hypothetical protein n=1 Tax=Pantoea sp. RRHST58 TaxID=3425183 RepID=UPI003D9FDBAF
MNKYVFFYKSNFLKAIQKDLITVAVKKNMKERGYKKHHIEVEADNEVEAVTKFAEFNDGYLNSLKDFSGSILICALVVVFMAVIYIVRTY